MLRANLATLPAHNRRLVWLALAALALVVVVLTSINVVRYVSLTLEESALGARAIDTETEAARLQAAAIQARTQIDPQALARITRAASEAEDIITRRTFSWSALFARFERTLPDDVRITAIRPAADDASGFTIAMAIEAQGAEDIDRFIEALESMGGFSEVLATEVRAVQGASLQALLTGHYEATESGPRTSGAGDTP